MTGFAKKAIIIDAKGHLLGRLASIVAKALLRGEKVTVLRCEQMHISGNFFRSKLKFLSFLRKRCNVNPARGPFHFRAPSRIFFRTVRGMLPHKTYRGENALHHLKAYEGIPPAFTKRRRVVVPSAMSVLCLRPGRKYCHLGRLSHEVGWKYQNVVRVLEAKRKAKEFVRVRKVERKQHFTRLATKNLGRKVKRYQKIIESYGYK
ncbi:60S ribosomal protein L13A, putative [Pediculus humanus corporis]|uniref:Large ribosomal subunit protein uL13 n=1 Tax=Pediculus humanus subsp. corporis TaxID=121224 RepID=E0VX11_PEDHC|nr:60S ribosomal protein L13A, putative [Pediculus humanus corporis]EEB17917.1 60S ribosomal protein L13A, putative [Pediculus humanus corporis]